MAVDRPTVRVSNIPQTAIAKDLFDFFESTIGKGSVYACEIVSDRKNWKSKGFGRVQFETLDSKSNATRLCQEGKLVFKGFVLFLSTSFDDVIARPVEPSNRVENGVLHCGLMVKHDCMSVLESFDGVKAWVMPERKSLEFWVVHSGECYKLDLQFDYVLETNGCRLDSEKPNAVLLKEMSSGTGSLGSTCGTPMEEDDHAPLWCYVTKLEKMGGGGNTRFKCNYCQQEYRGSYFRVKAHLLKLSGNGIRVCPKVTPQHLAEMQRKIEEAEKRLKMAMPKKVPLPPSTQSTSTGSGALDIGGFRMEGYELRKRKATGTFALEKAFNPVIREQLHSEIARMFYSAGLPFHLSRNPY